MMYVLGSLAFDRIMDFGGRFKDHILPEKIHAISVSFLIDELTERFGGTAGNIAYNLALLGNHPSVIANAGKDFKPYQQWMQRRNIDTSHVRSVSDVPTATAMIMNDQDNNQITAFYPGAFSHPLDLEHVQFAQSDIVIIAPALKDHMMDVARRAADAGARVMVVFGQNMTQFDEEDVHRLLSNAHVTIANDHETAFLQRAIQEPILETFPQMQCMISTKGIEGSEIITRDREFSIAAVQVDNAPDPTGAGDAFVAGFTHAWALARSPEECAQLGSVTASFAVEHIGTQEHHYSTDDLGMRFESTYGKPLFPLKESAKMPLDL